MPDVDCIVVGAGVIGLAAARELAIAGLDCVILEANGVIGNETSSRNSEVIHAGIYYPKDSLKAIACVAGKWMLYDYLDSHHLAYKRVTKLIVATHPGEAATLADIKARAAANGVGDLMELDAGAVANMEPALQCHSALLSPSTGIIDSHAYMLSLLGEAQDHGAMLALNTRFERAEKIVDGFRVIADSDGESTAITATNLVNCAGLNAQQVASRVDALAADFIPPLLTVKGNYFILQGRGPFSRLIYPVPEKHGLGVHVTLDLAGGTRFGPDTEEMDSRNDYAVDPARGDVFYAAIRKYWPSLQDGALTPGYAGIRPKVAAPDQDFRVEGESLHGVSGLVNYFGIESPGLTSSLHLARLGKEKLIG